MQPGTFIKSTSLLDGSFFEDTLIFITEYNERGAIGFIVNKSFPRALNELQEFRHSPAFPLSDGGPVDREHLFIIHRCPELISGGTHVANNLYVGGEINDAVKHINNKTLTEKDICLFIGYCGWDAGELEAEVAEGSWEYISHKNLLPHLPAFFQAIISP
ncbi:MAG: YqgE/AlgH family protein [Chitinophagaceae bacterium]|jgi:putative transcriptional regulator